ncbi:SDR family NAD(P)-dependent oxidoreductase [Rugosimonospora africana]|uniref:Short-chain dehydrogenase n=1 Tax=Rugosimonospora africana TaxID=556532 RepID=A0A8J3QVU4_9ACTN|nr:SDR family NAD(P)-dependent oxidoreductase [Rugosimonospora africana]GIH17431.1 short-chain dehydrogenase [Rugosimonospora africana]
MEIAGRVVVVTGASSGIGAATARLAAARGARVVLAARRVPRLEELAAELPDALVVPADVREPEQVHDVIRSAVDRYGTVDVLINNAGQGLHVPIEDIKLDDFAAVMELNVYGALAAMQAVLPVMRAGGGGAIVNVSSGTSRAVIPGVGGYAASKSALNMLSQVARAEFAPDNIVVSLVYPSVTATEFHSVLRAGTYAGGGRFAPQRAEQVAEAILRAVDTGEPEVVLAHTPAS